MSVISLSAPSWAQQAPYLHAPAVNEYAKHDPDGTTILADGRLLKPIGKSYALPRWPHGLAMTKDGSKLFVACDGVGQLVSDWNTGSPVMSEVYPLENGTRKRKSNAGGAVFSPDGKTLYWSGGENGEVYIFNADTREKIAEVSLNTTVAGRNYADSFAMDLKISDDGKSVYCADVTNFRVVVIDTVKKAVVGSVNVGRYPYALTVANGKVYVANVGMFEYSAIGLPMSGDFDKRGLTFPPFGFPSIEALNGTVFEGRTIPGLGDPNVPESFSVWSVNVSNPSQPKVEAKIKTGLKVGIVSNSVETVGGSAPNYLTAANGRIYVSNNNNDSIDTISLNNDAVTRSVRISPSPLTAKVRGLSPSGMVVSPDGRRIYVTEAGLNAIAVLDTRSNRVIGQIPTAWYPYRVTISPDGKKLAVISFRGFGNGPNAGKQIPKSPFLGMRGSLTVLDVPTDGELKSLTQSVLEYNGLVDKRKDLAALSSPVIPTTPGKVSEQIKYVVFITKENHTYDTIFDRIPGANDDPSLLRWGYHQKISSPGQPDIEDAAVMTNHNALARQFCVSDNFYMEPEASGVGHRWLIGVQPNNFCQMTYTLGWDFRVNSTAPGRRASFGSNGSIAPEDYPEAGSMWEHLARHGKTFRNYGESFEFAGVGEDEGEGVTGAREVINMPMSKVVYDNTCRTFPIFNMNIPDVFRADLFAQDFTKLFIDGKKPMPQFVNICICNDHGTGPKAARGYPYYASWMADNDLSLGRIVEFLSHTPYWKNMAIFVTQDDSGGEPDHVDAQRSVLLVISPWAKRGSVSHRHTTIVSMHRTMYQIFGMPPLNLQDAIANDFSDCFTTTPDFKPYTAEQVDPRIFDPVKAMSLTDPEFRKARSEPSIARDADDEVERNERRGANR